MKTTMTAAELKTALEAWDTDDTDAYSIAAANRMVEVAKRIFAALPGVRSVDLDTATAGSYYLAIRPDHDDASEVTVRLSNHARKPNSHVPPAWSFEHTDSLTSIEQGIAAVSQSVQDEIENATA